MHLRYNLFEHLSGPIVRVVRMHAGHRIVLCLLILAAGTLAGCVKAHRHGASSGGPSWSISTENPIPGIDHGTANISKLTCGPPEGVTVVVWSDLGNGSRSSAAADSRRAYDQVTHTGAGGRTISYTVETIDGESATITLQGATFTTTAGNLFLVSTQQGTPRVAQINLNVEDFPDEANAIKQFALDHEEIKDFFESAAAADKAKAEAAP